MSCLMVLTACCIAHNHSQLSKDLKQEMEATWAISFSMPCVSDPLHLT